MAPQPMVSGGVYDHHSDYQLRGAISEIELVESLAAKLAVGEELDGAVIADYGCAQGRVTNLLIGHAIERIRADHLEAALTVLHNDLLSNDWTTFLKHLSASDSYLSIPGGPITPLISAISFYEPVAPPHIVDLGLSFAAAQWLASPGPADAGTALYFDQLDGAARERMADQAHADWTTFLRRRADELAAGGRLVINLMGVPDGGTAAGHDAWEMVRAICVELAGEGLLDPADLARYVIPIYERTEEEVRRPFAERGSASASSWTTCRSLRWRTPRPSRTERTETPPSSPAISPRSSGPSARPASRRASPRAAQRSRNCTSASSPDSKLMLTRSPSR